MVDSVQGLLLLVLTMPGFFGYLWFNLIYEGCIEDTFEKVGIVVGLNTAALVVAQLLGMRLPVDLFGAEQQATIAGTVEFVARHLLFLSLIATVLGMLIALMSNSKRLSRLLRSWGLTRKSNANSILADVIREHPDRYFRVRFKDGGYVIGHPRVYSLDGEQAMLFLADAAVRPRGAAGQPMPVERELPDGVMLLGFDEIRYVELV